MSTNTELIARSERVASELDDHNANMDRRARTCIRELVAALKSMEQAITDPENQPSQFGTVLLVTHQALEAERDALLNSASALDAEAMRLSKQITEAKGVAVKVMAERDALQAQLAAAQGQSWSDDQMIRFAWLILNRQNDDDSIEHRLNVFRERELSAPIPQQPSVPEGWKLVPIEPDLKMVIAGENYIGRHAWTKMLAAAPQPKEPK